MGKDRWTHGNRGGHKRGGFNRGGFDRGRGRSRGGFRGQGYSNRGNNGPWQKRERNDAPGNRLSEVDIGVTEYMSDHQGFNGIIKLRFSDFQVSEINEQGEVAKLTNMKPPEPDSVEEVLEDEDLFLSKYNVEILPMDTWNQLNKVLIGDDPGVTNVVIDVTTSTKEERTKIHEAVKKAFGESIIGSTVNVGDEKIMKFEKYRKGVRFDKRVKWTWGAEYVHFVVHKEHCDTMEAAHRIIEGLKSNVKLLSLGFAGTKDRRAKTSQWFSLKKMDPKKIANACKHINNIHVGNYTFKDYALKLGMLKGNKFRIALRNVTAAEGTLGAACARLAAAGFINYYGLQRFGSNHHLPTHRVGKLLLQGNYREAIDTILAPRAGPLQPALAVLAGAGPRAAAHLLPRYNSSAEAKMIMALADNPKDLLGALFRIPRNTRLLYLHSYQSLQWNRVVSERIRTLGLRPAPGDLVQASRQDLAEEPDYADAEDKEDDEEGTSENALETDDNQQNKDNKQDVQKTVPVRILTQEDIDNETYTIYDVIMPLAGYQIQYPPNMKDYYEKLLKEDGLTMELKSKHKHYSLSGTYRRVAIRPDDVEWSTVQYSDPHGDLLLSDLDLLRGRTRTAALEDGIYKALLISFSLPSSCYATMALREILKVDTSSNTQATQNNYHKRKMNNTDQQGEKRAKTNSEGENTMTSETEGENAMASETERENTMTSETEEENAMAGETERENTMASETEGENAMASETEGKNTMTSEREEENTMTSEREGENILED